MTADCKEPFLRHKTSKMRKFLFLLFILSIANAASAQIAKDMKLPVKTTEARLAKINSLPDIVITSLSVKQTRTSDTRTRTDIHYTVKNIGNARISQADITIQGYLTEEMYKDRSLASNMWKPAGGRILGQSHNYINPGQELSGMINSFSSVYPATKLVYLLEAIVKTPEMNTSNNQQISYIIFE